MLPFSKYGINMLIWLILFYSLTHKATQRILYPSSSGIILNPTRREARQRHPFLNLIDERNTL